MDKRTVIAVVLAVVVIVGSMLIQNKFFPQKEPPAAPPAPSAQQVEPQTTETQQTETGQSTQETTSFQQLSAEQEEALEETEIKLESDVFDITFSNRGAVVTSIKLKEFANTDGSQVEMLLPRDSGRFPFTIHFGDVNAPAVDALFHYEEGLVGTKATFYRVFNSPSGVPFKLIKTYELLPDDYMIKLDISIENSINEYPDLNFNGVAYTLGFGPQIGPDFKKLDRRNEYRNYLYYANGKKKTLKVSKTGVTVLEERPTWTSVVGKYFEVIAVPDATEYRITYDTREISGLDTQSSVYFSRPQIKSSKNTDVFRFFVGPKKRDVLLSYNDPVKNAHELKDMHFEETVSASILIGWLATIFKFILELFYKVIPNYGVAIILLTLLIKALLYPLTRKSFQSTSKMQALQPKLNELKEKYKNNPQKMQQEQAALYKKEGVNPLGGCLPMLLQMPVFFAFYNLLSNHFELRGATFIPGWIVDLSVAESVWNFAPTVIPILKTSDLRLLPFIMVATTFLQSRFTQTDSSNKQMKMMTTLMPLFFFFILYEMPSGLVLYWTVQNIVSVIQQIVINKRQQKKAPEES